MNCALCHEGLATVPIQVGDLIEYWCEICFVKYRAGCPNCMRNPCVCFEGETPADRLSQAYQRVYDRESVARQLKAIWDVDEGEEDENPQA